MAQKRMFDKSVIDSDSFLDMPLSSQALYFHLNMRADDEGFIDNARRIMRMIGINEDDLKILVAKNFVIPFESGVIVMRHWKINNYLNQSRIKKTLHEKEKQMLTFNKHNEYIRLTDVKHMLNENTDKPNENIGLTDVKHLPKESSIEESSIEECSIEYINNNYNKKKENAREILAKYFNREISEIEVEQFEKLITKFEDLEIIEKALVEAIKNNVLKLSYVEAILVAWKKKHKQVQTPPVNLENYGNWIGE